MPSKQREIAKNYGYELPSCGDNSCVFGSRGGMSTNGGCQCDDRTMRHGIQMLMRIVNALDVVVHRVKVDNDSYKESYRAKEREAESYNAIIDDVCAVLNDKEVPECALSFYATMRADERMKELKKATGKQFK
jgi:hypothetical protein